MDEQTKSINQEQHEENSVDLGTLKDVEALKKSYDNLRSEFTRKSQELAKMQKNLGDKEEFSTPPSVADDQKTESETNTEQTDFWEDEKWQQDVDQFFKERSLSAEQKRDLAELLIQDKQVQSSASPLYVAYAKLLEKNVQDIQNLSQNQDFLNKYIYNNEQIKNKIISEYVSSLNKTDNIPEVMPNLAANLGEVHTSPKTLSEAKQLATKYFD